MVAPEKWRQVKRFPASQDVARRRLTLTLRHHPMFDTNSPRARIGPARDVAGGKNSRRVRFQIFVDQNSVISSNPRFFRERGVWPNPDSNCHEVAIQDRSAVEADASVLNGYGCSPQMKLHTMRLVSFLDQLAQFASENFFQWKRSFADHCNFKFALAQRRCHFEADKAGADHHRALRIFRLFNDAAAVSKSSQITNVG